MSGDDWNANEYASFSRPQQTWARAALARLGLKPYEAVLDVGCGDGKITAEIATVVSPGQVAGVDNSPAMIDLANRSYPSSQHSNLRFVLADAAALDLDVQFDLVFSNSALHWVKDHPAVLRGIARSLKRGGRIYLAFGATGTAPGVRATFDELVQRSCWSGFFDGFVFPLTLNSREDYQRWLPEAGLDPSRVDVVTRDMQHAGKEGLAGWFRTTWFPYINRVPNDQRSAFVDESVELYVARHPVDASGLVHVKMISLEVEAHMPKGGR